MSIKSAKGRLKLGTGGGTRPGSALRGSYPEKGRHSSEDLIEIDEEDENEEETVSPASQGFAVNVIKPDDLNDSGQLSSTRPSLFGSSPRGTRKRYGKGEIRYSIVEVEPSSPRLMLSEKSLRRWETKIQSSSSSACRDAKPSSDFSDAGGKTSSNVRIQSPHQPVLSWYAEELSLACGRVLVPAPAKVRALQERHNINPKILEDSKQLWALLLEVAIVFLAASYHVQRAVVVLGNEAAKLFCSNKRSAASGHRLSFDFGADMKLPQPPFAPKSADGALADLHLSICRLQTMGPQLATILQRFAQGVAVDAVGNVERLLNVSPKRGHDGAFGEYVLNVPLANSEYVIPAEQQNNNQSRLQKLFLVVPCVEEAVDRLGSLLGSADLLQAAKSSDLDAKKPKSNMIDSVDDTEDKSDGDDDLDIAEDITGINLSAEDHHDLVEAAIIADAPKRNSSRPSSARRRGTNLETGSAGGSSRPTSATKENQANENASLQQSDSPPPSRLGSRPPSVEPERKEKKDEKSEKTTKKKGKKKKAG